MSARIIISALILALVAGHTSAQRVTLVLTGGGARCITQVGVLKVLEREGLQPDLVVGSSFGSIVGGLYCSGYSAQEIDSIFKSIDWDDIAKFRGSPEREHQFLSQKVVGDRSILTLRFNNFRFVPPTAIGGNTRFSYMLQHVLWESPLNTVTAFDRFDPPIRVVATDLSSGRAVAIDSGNLATAIRASATFPLRFSPVRWNNEHDQQTMLVDGGLVANIPTDVAKRAGAEKIILVDATTKLTSIENVSNPWAVADQSLSAAMMQLDSTRLALADIIIQPDLGEWNNFSFTNIDSLVTLGEQAALHALPEIRELFKGSLVDSVDVERISITTTDKDTALASALKQKLKSRYSRASRRDVLRHLSRLVHQYAYELAVVRAPDRLSAKGQDLWTIDKGLVQHRSYDLAGSAGAASLAREAAFPDSANYQISDLSRAWQNLHASDALAESEIVVSSNATGGNSVSVSAIGSGNQAIRIGARVDNERYTQGSLEIAHNDLFTTGLRLVARGSLSERIGSIAAGFDVPRISGSLWTASLRGYSSFRNVWVYSNRPGRPGTQRLSEFSEDRYGARLSAGRQLERNGLVQAELRYENQRYRNLKDSVQSAYQPLATIRGIARWDDRDNIAFPTRGRTIDLSAETSVLSLSNGVSFTKLSASVNSVFNLGWFTAIPSFLIGAADKTLPSADLFSIGGEDLFFGMREDQQRGRQIVVGNLEIRAKLPFDILFDTHLSVRYDIGAVWEVPEYIRIADMNHGLGITLGIDTPIGPARLSAGRAFAFQEKPNKVLLGTTLAYFSIGVRL